MARTQHDEKEYSFVDFLNDLDLASIPAVPISEIEVTALDRDDWSRWQEDSGQSKAA